jgi:hypothetical protein
VVQAMLNACAQGRYKGVDPDSDFDTDFGGQRRLSLRDCAEIGWSWVEAGYF